MKKVIFTEVSPIAVIEFKMLQKDCEVRKIQYRLEVTLVHV